MMTKRRTLKPRIYKEIVKEVEYEKRVHGLPGILTVEWMELVSEKTLKEEYKLCIDKRIKELIITNGEKEIKVTI